MHLPKHTTTDHLAALLRLLKDVQQDYDEGWINADEYKTEVDGLTTAMHELA